MINKTFIAFIVSIIIFIVFIQIFIGIKNIVFVLSRTNLFFFFLSVLSVFIGIGIWGFRWKMLFKRIGINIRWRDVYKYLFIGLMFNNITPFFRFGGEPIRSYLVSKKLSKGQDQVFATIGMDSFFQLVSFIFMAYLSIVFLSILNIPIWSALFLSINIIILFILLLFLLFTQKDVLDKTISVISRIMGKFNRNCSKKFKSEFHKFIKNVMKIGSDKSFLFRMVSLSFLERIVDIVSFYLCFLSIGYNIPLIFSAISLGVGVIGGAIPLFPGGLVTYESFIIIVLSLLGISANISAAGIFVWRFISFWLIIVIGFIISWYSGIKILRR